MRMSDVKVGMLLQSTLTNPVYPVTVTEITENGFAYHLDERENLVINARLGMITVRDGHEHYGVNGQALFEEVKA